MKVRDEVVVLGDPNAPTSWGLGYAVIAYSNGAVVDMNQGPQTSNIITVHTGHSFDVGDRGLLWRPGVVPGLIPPVLVANPTSLQFGGTVQVYPGDRLINLGVETGDIPTYNGSKVTIYQDPDGTRPLNQSRVTVGNYGQYQYYHNLDGWWEVLIDPQAVVVSLKEIGTVNAVTPV